MNLKKNLKKFFTFARRDGGFTLVELVVVIAILGVLAGVAVPAYSGYVKKANIAADEALLSEINTAFAAACAVNGTDVYHVDGAYMELTDAKTINLTKVAPYGDAFGQFYAGNESSAFTVYDGIYFNLQQHKFVAGTAAYSNALKFIMKEYPREIDLVKLSAYATKMGAADLMGTVHGVTGLAAEMLKSDTSTLTQMVLGNEAYLENLANMLGMEGIEELGAKLDEMDDSGAQFLANSTVLSVATTVNSDGYDRQALTDKLATGELGSVVNAIVDSENGLAEAALIYGLYAAYAPDKAGEINGLSDLGKLTEDQEGFMAYLATLNQKESQASKDLDGYYAALEIVNAAVSNDPDVANRVMNNGYNDEELVGLLGSVIGG